MAVVIKKKSPLRSAYRRLSWAAALSCGVGILSLMVFFAAFLGLRQPSWLDMVLLLIFGLGMIAGTVFSGKRQVLRAGLQGEESAAELVSHLPESYRCYQNLTVSHRGKASEMDLVITGPTGIFIVEVKHQNGTVFGRYGDSHWVQDKLGRKGGNYKKQFYSPVKQVGTHTFRLANWLRSRGLNTHISSMVYFSNPETELHLKGDPQEISVFAAACDGGRALCQAIRKNSDRVPAKLLKEINGQLDRL